MAIVTLPHETAQRLQPRIGDLIENAQAKLFPASDIVMGLIFTPDETKEFNGEQGEAMILAAPNLDTITAAIPEFEDDRRNYCIIKNERAIARLDPFAQNGA